MIDPAIALTGRCTLLVAAAGYGKTAAVRRWLGGADACWHAGALPDSTVDGAQWVIVDDLAAARAADVRHLLARLPATARLVLVSRWPLAATPALRRQGLVAERGPGDLALSAADTGDILREYGVSDPARATQVHRLTGGWPALVHFAGDRLQSPAPTGDAECTAVLAEPGGPAATFLEKQVLGALPAAGARLARDLAWLGPADEGLCAALGHSGRALALLAESGLIQGTGRQLVPLLAEVCRDRWPLAESERHRLSTVAGDWYARAGLLPAALSAYRLGRPADVARLLREHGAHWVVAGGAAPIASAVRALPVADRCAELRLLLGEALTVLGEDDLALAELTALAADDPVLPPGVAWRLGMVHYLRADPRAAMAACARGRLTDEATADEALLLAWGSAARWMAADPDPCGALARRAMAAAGRADCDRARAAAHVALAMHAMLAGDRSANSAQYAAALRCAESAGDIVQAARVRVNLSALLLEEAHYADALAEARRAEELAEATGYAAMLAVALCNAGEALFRMTRLDEAAGCYRRALAVLQRKGSRKVAYPLVGLGAIHRAQGRHNLARAAYEEAARVATDAGDVQGMVPALAGLARVLVDIDPDAAARHASAALDAASGPFVAEALLAMGWVRLGTGDRDGAARTADEAATQARRHRDSSRLAEALELAAAAATEPADARRALSEAAETWRLTGAQLDLDRVSVALAALPDAPVTERIEARLARDRLCAAGVVATADPATPSSTVDIRSLGRFEVWVGDTAVTMSMWQSRKARDLLRILVARRGRAIPRDELTDLLWPGEDSDRLAHRLSVALSTVRAVLDPDRTTPADHYVLADRAAVALEVEHLSVDVEAFLSEARHGFALRDRGSLADAHAVLAAAERRYAGDFLENEPYEDWSVATREEARATYMRTVRALAQLSRDVGQVDDAVHYLLRVLDKDPYDERGHTELVDTLALAGRHGESRRAEARYVAAMGEIGVPASRLRTASIARRE